MLAVDLEGQMKDIQYPADVSEPMCLSIFKCTYMNTYLLYELYSAKLCRIEKKIVIEYIYS